MPPLSCLFFFRQSVVEFAAQELAKDAEKKLAGKDADLTKTEKKTDSRGIHCEVRVGMGPLLLSRDLHSVILLA